MCKDQCPSDKQTQPQQQQQQQQLGLNRTNSNVSYTDQLKSLLQAHQSSQREQRQRKEGSPAPRDKRTPSPQAEIGNLVICN